MARYVREMATELAIYVFQNGNGRNKMVINEMSLVRYRIILDIELVDIWLD